MRDPARMRSISIIVIHCSASPNADTLFRGRHGQPGFLTPVHVIDMWHALRGFHRRIAARECFNPRLQSIGYHYIVYRNGAIATGRHEDEIGAHVAGHNINSLGICLVGNDVFTLEQWAALRALVTALHEKHPLARIVGHRDLSPDRNGDGKITRDEWIKSCPNFDVSAWLKNDMEPPK
jgi:N-acetyl-anhydromuramyl-L-alanine amidase AmpD